MCREKKRKKGERKGEEKVKGEKNKNSRKRKYDECKGEKKEEYKEMKWLAFLGRSVEYLDEVWSFLIEMGQHFLN